MAHRRTPRIYAPRRVPQSFSPAYTAMRLIPLVPALLASGALGLVSELPALSEEMRQKARHASQSMGDDSSERSQRLFFDEPGLDTLFVRFLAGSAQAVSHVAKTVMRARIALEPDSPMGKRAAQALPLVPKRAYDTLMTGMLSIGTAVGYIHSGPVHAQVIADSAEASSIDPPAGHATAVLRRWEAPQSLGDLCADIDDMYWSMTDGHTVKITRVGEGEARRWLVSLPGTAHMDFESNANPADMESNIREMIGIESNMRSGLVMAIHDAMKRDGLNSEEYAMEPVLICGHSQGGLVATVLASMNPKTAGLDVQAILATGAPARRYRIRPDVTMVSLAHDQDVIPSMDGTPARQADHRVTIGRKLVRPRRQPLYYAHSSATYTETARQLERMVKVNPWGRTASAVAALQDFLPQDDEATRVMFYEIWQDVTTPTSFETFDPVATLAKDDSVTPVEFDVSWPPSSSRATVSVASSDSDEEALPTSTVNDFLSLERTPNDE